MRRLLIGAFLASSLIFAAPAPAGHLSATKYPNSIVVLGHSGATGFGSDPAHPYRDAPQNSWATGTNPAVDSVYLRILAANPAVRGHNVNLSQDGATLKEFAVQVHKAVALKPAPELVLVQIGDDDIRCDGNDASRYGEFRTGFSVHLDALAKGLPNARIFVISSWGSFASYVKYLEGLDTKTRLKHAGKAICQMVSAPSGRIVPAHVAYLKKTVEGYEAQLAAACKTFPNCRYDGGAAARIAVTADDLTVDQDHLTIPGQAKLAAAVWPAISSFVK